MSTILNQLLAIAQPTANNNTMAAIAALALPFVATALYKKGKKRGKLKTWCNNLKAKIFTKLGAKSSSGPTLGLIIFLVVAFAALLLLLIRASKIAGG